MSKIFTSLPAPLNKITSNTFADNGNPGETPASISDINIYTPPIKKNIQYALFREYLYAHTAASLKEMQVIIKPENPFVFTGGYQEENVLSQPPVGFSFPGMANDANAELMSGLGFVKEKVANRTFYRGQLSDTSFQRIGLLRVNIDTPVPYGLTSVRGWITFGLCERIILNALKAIPKPLWNGEEQNIKYRGEYTSDGRYIATETNISKKSAKDAICFSPSAITSDAWKYPGIVFPYFHTLLLPDKTYVPNLINTHFFNLLSNKLADVSAAQATMASIRVGWKSLASTETGLALTHLAYCLDMALKTGARPLIIRKDSGAYGGFVLVGDNLQIIKNNVLHRSSEPNTVCQILQSLSQHEIGLRELVDRLNSLDDNIRVAHRGVVFTRNHFDTPRHLHNIIRQMKFNLEQKKELMITIKKLDYPAVYWPLNDLKNMARVAEKISNSEYFDDSVPCPYKTELIFSNDATVSALLAYGLKAPSLSSKTGETFVIPNVSTGDQSLLRAKIRKGKTLPKLGIFVDSIEIAVSRWRVMKNNGTITLNFKKKDLPDAKWSYPCDSTSASQLAELLTSRFGRSAREKKAKNASTNTKGGSKRKADDEGTSSRKKKARLADEFSALADMLGIFPEGYAPMDMDDEDDDEDAEPTMDQE